MIEQVTNLTKKSFNGYSGPIEKFKLKNVIFGYNGRGKSSLALGIKDAYSNEPTSSDNNFRFFNKDYVEDNLILKDPLTGNKSKDKILGVIAHFSNKDVKAEDEIKKLQDKIIELGPIRSQLEGLKDDARKSVNAIHDRRKGTANIARKNKDFEIEKVIELYTQDLDAAKKIEADETKLAKIEGDNVIGEKIELLKTLGFTNLDKLTDQEIDEASALFSKSFSSTSIPSSDIVDWLNEGITLHEDGDNCKFCNNSMSLKDIRNRVSEYNANEKQKATKFLKNLDEKIAELQNVIKLNLDKEANIRSSLDADPDIDTSYQTIKDSSIVIANARNAVQTKVKNIDNLKTGFIDFKDALKAFNGAIKKLEGIRYTQQSKLEAQNSSKDVLVKGAIGLEILNDKNISDKMNDIRSKEKELNDAVTSNKKLNDDIQTLKQSESATADFAEYISSILSNLNIHLKVIVSSDGKNYIIQHTQTRSPLTMSDISEGERNLLALLFFYYELFDDNEQQNFKSNIEMIVVDDPISSMDDINKMYIIELLKQLLSLEAPQVFLMTHSWDDFVNLCYNHKDTPSTPYAFFEIKKDLSGKSVVQKTRSNISPYHHNFVEVYNFSQKPDTTNLDDCDVYHMPNIIRQVLEGFLQFKVRRSSPTKDNEQEIARVLFDKEWATVTEDEKTKLGQLLLVINVNSHSSSRSPDEVLASSKFLMGRLKKIDERHYNTNKEPVI
jgi:wobble nucleotide-excising tRNase